jgi:subtilase-type serine protease
VAGAAALVRHKFPNLNGPQLKQVLLHSADDLGADGPDEIYGYGALDVLGALSPMLDENGKLTK